MGHLWEPWDGNPLDLANINSMDLQEARIVPAVLVEQGYSVTFSGNLPVLTGTGIPVVPLLYGQFNLWFMLHWVEWSLGTSYSGKFLKRSWKGPSPRISVLGTGYDVYIDYPLLYARANTYWDFSNRNIGSTFGQIYDDAELGMKTGVPMFSGLAYSMPSKADEVPTGLRAWKICVAGMSVEERTETVSVLSTRFNYYYHPTKAEVYFTNDADVRKKLPPTASMLGLPKLYLIWPLDANQRRRDLADTGVLRCGSQ